MPKRYRPVPCFLLLAGFPLKARKFPFTKEGVRFIARILFLLLALVLLAGGAFLALYNGWLADRLEAVRDGHLVAPKVEGDIQYAVRGEGPPIVVLHATPGGYDQALLFGRPLAEAGFQVIAPSRAGYLETGLGTGPTPEEFADSVANFLERFDYPPVGVVGVSGGSPIAAELAARHPDKVAGVALISPIVARFRPNSEPDERGLLGDIIAGQGISDLTLWRLQGEVDRDPTKLLSRILEREPDLSDEARSGIEQAVSDSPEQQAWLQDLLRTLSPLSARAEGVRNDIVQLKNLPPTAWQDITAPILLIRGEQDRDLSSEEILNVGEALPRAQLLSIENAGHLPWLSPAGNQVDPALIEFFEANLKQP